MPDIVLSLTLILKILYHRGWLDSVLQPWLETDQFSFLSNWFKSTPNHFPYQALTLWGQYMPILIAPETSTR